MPSPIQTIQRRDLGTLVSEYALEQSRTNFVGLQIMPVFESILQTGNYPVIPVQQVLKPRDVRRGNRGAYNRGDWGFTQGNFSCVEYGWEEVIDDALAANYRTYFDAESWASRIATDVLLRAQEKRIADHVEAQSANNVVKKWNNYAEAAPRDDVQLGIMTILDNTGRMPDALQLTYATFQHLLKTDMVQEAIKYTSALAFSGFEAQRTALAGYLGVSTIMVANAVENTSNEGLGFSPSQIWNDAKAFLFISNSGGIESGPQFGKSFIWTGDSPDNVNVESYREEQSRGTVVRVRHWTDEKVLNSRAGYLLGNLV